MSRLDRFAGSEDLRRTIAGLFETPEYSEWKAKTDVISLSDLREWMKSSNIEILGFAYGRLGDQRFRIEPPISLEEYVGLRSTISVGASAKIPTVNGRTVDGRPVGIS